MASLVHSGVLRTNQCCTGVCARMEERAPVFVEIFNSIHLTRVVFRRISRTWRKKASATSQADDAAAAAGQRPPWRHRDQVPILQKSLVKKEAVVDSNLLLVILLHFFISSYLKVFFFLSIKINVKVPNYPKNHLLEVTASSQCSSKLPCQRGYTVASIRQIPASTSKPALGASLPLQPLPPMAV